MCLYSMQGLVRLRLAICRLMLKSCCLLLKCFAGLRLLKALFFVSPAAVRSEGEREKEATRRQEGGKKGEDRKLRCSCAWLEAFCFDFKKFKIELRQS